MTKEQLNVSLNMGKTILDLFPDEIKPGQECEIMKADQFTVGDQIIYIPDFSLNGFPMDYPVRDKQEIPELIGCCYTGNDFLKITGGDVEKAKMLFDFCDWQHPSSAWDEPFLDEEPEEKEAAV